MSSHTMDREALLACLKESEGYLSGEQLSERFQVSRTAVWKGISALREQGYRIDSAPSRGYRLAYEPDSLTPDRISDGLAAKRLGSAIFCYPELDSTNEEAKRQARRAAPDGSVFLTEHQTSGKGRLGRSWNAPSGTGLWFSLLLRDGFTPQNVSPITLLAGLAVCRAIRSHTGCKAEIKWPNDVIIGSRKICGILTEMAAEMDRVEYLVTGIGVNINMPDFPDELQKKATSLRIETGSDWERAPLLRTILEELERLLEYLPPDGDFTVPEDYKRLCATLHRKISFTRGGKQLSGEALDIAPGGDLIVRAGDGTVYTINSGEVTVQGIYGQAVL